MVCIFMVTSYTALKIALFEESSSSGLPSFALKICLFPSLGCDHCILKTVFLKNLKAEIKVSKMEGFPFWSQLKRLMK